MITVVSLPSRGAWIEIATVPNHVTIAPSRSPRGERGLKLYLYYITLSPIWSLPSRGAWIEIIMQQLSAAAFTSLPSRGAWIEIKDEDNKEDHS